MNQFEIELSVNSAGLGSQKLLILAKMNQFEIELSVNSAGLGVPKGSVNEGSQRTRRRGARILAP